MYPILCYRMGESSISALLNAHLQDKRTGDGIRIARRMFDMTESRLRCRLSNPGSFTQNVGQPTIFSRAEEAQLADYCKRDQIRLCICRWHVLQMAGNMTQQTGRAKEPKMEWYGLFIKRFADLSIQKTKQRRNVEVRGTNDVNVKNYFQELDKFLTKYNPKKNRADIEC